MLQHFSGMTMSKVHINLAVGTVCIPLHGTCLVPLFGVHPSIIQILRILGDFGG